MSSIVCSGGLFVSAATGRFLFLKRADIKTENTWGLIGGKKETSDYSNVDTLKREMYEEVGDVQGILKTVPLDQYISGDSNFYYNTFVVVVKEEFCPVLNEEHTGYCWCSFNDWPFPLHKGVRRSLSNKVIKAKLEVLLSLIGSLSEPAQVSNNSTTERVST